MRLVDWFLALGLGQKIVVGVALAAVLFLATLVTYLASLLILSSAGVGPPEAPPSQQSATPAPASLRPGGSASVSSEPDYALKIVRARWEGEVAVVEGTWRGDVSSVHCDLFEGDYTGQAIDWWDRSVPAEMSFSDRTFSQDFVRARGDLEDPIDPEGEYWMKCWAFFSEGSAAGDDTAVEGTPPAR
ncbi:MAG TPA: hypothetical protein VFY59_18210 [Rubrobacter sp.]|jgi:hypothetical protein|nr:hypothetical protein [Rubrobacter sp.]